MAAGDTKQVTGASINLTITLASLASDSNLLLGRESNIIDNSTNEYIDYLLSGFITSGAAPSVSTPIEVWVYGSLDDAYTLPDTLTGADADCALTNTNVKGSGLRVATVIAVTADASIKYPIAPLSIAELFGGRMPKKFGVFVVHATGDALDSTGGNHQLTVTPVFYNTAAI